MNEDIEVSVICFTYNQVNYIEKALSSFVSQKTDFKFEIIVHDDASTDGTVDIVRSFAERYPELITPILQTENQYSKKVKILEFLLPKAKGKYLALCDGDDFWCNDYKLQRQYDVMEANSDCSICVHETQNINEDGSVYPSVQGKYPGIQEGILDRETICKLFLKKPITIFHTSSFFIRLSMFRDVYLSNLEFAKFSTGGDQIMLRVCMTEGPFYFIDEIMTCYRRFAKGSINSSQKNMSSEYWKQYYSKYAVCNTKFDEYSNYEFHDYIRGWIGINIMNLGKYDTLGTKELLKEYGIQLKDLRIAHEYKYLVKYISIMMFPHFCSFMYKLKNMLKQEGSIL